MLRGDHEVLTVGREERNCGVVGTHSKGGMAMAGEGTPPTIESSENRAGADMAAGGGLPADGQDRGATADAGGMSMDESAQGAGAGAGGSGGTKADTETSRSSRGQGDMSASWQK